MRPICKIGFILENLAKKAPNLPQIFAEKWYRDGSQNHAFRGIEMVEILNSTLSIPVRNILKNPPGGKTYKRMKQTLFKVRIELLQNGIKVLENIYRWQINKENDRGTTFHKSKISTVTIKN